MAEWCVRFRIPLPSGGCFYTLFTPSVRGSKGLAIDVAYQAFHVDIDHLSFGNPLRTRNSWWASQCRRGTKVVRVDVTEVPASRRSRQKRAFTVDAVALAKAVLAGQHDAAYALADEVIEHAKR